MSLPAITLRQPWPRWLQLDEPAKILSRDEALPDTLVGKHVALHGGHMPKTGKDLERLREYMQNVQDRVFPDDDPVSLLEDDMLREICVGGIFAVASFDPSVTESRSPWFEGPHGWPIRHIRLFAEPIAARGKPGIWTVTGELLDQVRAAYGAAGKAPEREAPAPAMPDEIQAALRLLQEHPQPAQASEMASQQAYGTIMRWAIPKDPHQKYHEPQTLFSELAGRVLKKRVVQFRSLTTGELLTVARAALAGDI